MAVEVNKALLPFVDSRGTPHTRMAEIKEGSTRENHALALKATVTALKMLVKPCDVTIYTGNTYIKSCITNGWLEKWQQDGWVKPRWRTLSVSQGNINLWKDFYICMSFPDT